MFRGIAREVIDATPGFASVGEAASGEEAPAAVAELSPALVLIWREHAPPGPCVDR